MENLTFNDGAGGRPTLFFFDKSRTSLSFDLSTSVHKSKKYLNFKREHNLSPIWLFRLQYD